MEDISSYLIKLNYWSRVSFNSPATKFQVPTQPLNLTICKQNSFLVKKMDRFRYGTWIINKQLCRYSMVIRIRSQHSNKIMIYWHRDPTGTATYPSGNSALMSSSEECKYLVRLPISSSKRTKKWLLWVVQEFIFSERCNSKGIRLYHRSKI